MSTVLKLGTRKSMLAWAQSGWVARKIEALNPGVRVELVGIETQGDRILDISLQRVEGKGFFVAELDQALVGGTVDLTVHSMKDLSLERPAELVLAGIPRRENPRDVVLYGPGVIEKIRAGKTLRVGTSSPRRMENIPPFLAQALPRVDRKRPSVELVEIRGNVNTRLARVHESEGSARQLDGVVLAFAGLIRLFADETGRAELTRLLEGVRWMVLPLRECPTAPAQGALAIECRASDSRVREAIGRLHDTETARLVGREREILGDWGGGCHQRFGATCVNSPGVGELFWIRGVKPGDEVVDELRWESPPSPSGEVTPWDGTRWRPFASIEYRDVALKRVPEGGAAFFAHSRALPPGSAVNFSEARVWTSGTESWKRMAEEGLWVEGCAEGLGFAPLAEQLREPVLRLPPPAAWQVLTHDQAGDSWSEGEIVATYSVKNDYPPAAREDLARATHVFWSSASQFNELHRSASPEAHHACGPGKTADRLRASGLSPTVFPSAEEWRQWHSGKKPERP